jgi:hypothetical protein
MPFGGGRMDLEIVTHQRKIIKEFISNCRLYCDRISKANDLNVREKENNEDEAQIEKSALFDSIRELRTNLAHCKDSAEEAKVNIRWSSISPENIQLNKDILSRECYYQSINQARMKVELMDKSLGQYDEYFVDLEKKKSERKLYYVIVGISLAIIGCIALILTTPH